MSLWVLKNVAYRKKFTSVQNMVIGLLLSLEQSYTESDHAIMDHSHPTTGITITSQWLYV